MRRFILIIEIVLPILIILVVALTLYSRRQINDTLNESLETVSRFVDDRAAECSNLLTLLAANAEFIAFTAHSRYAAEPNPLLDVVRRYPRIHEIIIGYEPKFLADLREGKYPEFNNLCTEWFGDMIPETACVALYRDSGTGEVCKTQLENYLNQRWYTEVKTAWRPVWSSPSSFDIPVSETICSVPLYNKSEFLGVLAVGFDAHMTITQMITSGLESRPDKFNGKTFVINQAGRILVHGGFDTLPEGRAVDMIPPARRSELVPLFDAAFGAAAGCQKIKQWKNALLDSDLPADTWFVYSPVRNKPDLMVLATFDEASLLSPVYHKLYLIWGAGLGCIFLIALIVARKIDIRYRPILNLSRQVVHIADNNFTGRISDQLKNGSSETAVLARSFDKMMEQLQEYLQKTINEENLRITLENDVRIAQHIQRSLQPLKHSVSGWDYFSIDAALVPAHFVAGDFFDYWQIDDDCIAILVGDVSGKGIPASLIMVETRTLIRQISVTHPSISHILAETNRLLLDRNELAMFVTLFFAFYHFKTGRLEYTSAGHNPPIILRNSEKVEWFENAQGSVLGVLSNVKYPVCEKTLNKNDKLFIYTDGVTDSRPKNGEPFGEERLEALMTQLADKPVNVIVEGALAELDRYSCNDQPDDMTLFVIERL